ncbi:MAG: hypothetical protein OJF59_001749 [Cytophagales bacterium]|nr:MAG: hypothetical protein OJF59_001749 [Cytophagales bacterium]
MDFFSYLEDLPEQCQSGWPHNVFKRGNRFGIVPKNSDNRF